MIVDCHTHIWRPDAASEVNVSIDGDMSRLMAPPGGPGPLMAEATMVNHMAAADPVDKTIVLGFKSKYLKAEIPNEWLADYARKYPDKIVAFAGVDPTSPSEAIEDVKYASGKLGLKGIAVSPSGQDFHPADSGAMQVFAEAARLKMPVLFHSGTHFSVASKLDYARPGLLDEVARELPALKVVIAHLGYPWIDECIVMLGKHPNVYADISGLLHRPWQAFNALLSAYQYGVMDKLLFGSDFPFRSAAAAIEALYSVNQFTLGTSLPTVPRQYLQGIVERDALALLGIAQPAPSRRATTELLGDDDI
jgi:hypothetical protein